MSPKSFIVLRVTAEPGTAAYEDLQKRVASMVMEYEMAWAKDYGVKLSSMELR